MISLLPICSLEFQLEVNRAKKPVNLPSWFQSRPPLFKIIWSPGPDSTKHSQSCEPFTKTFLGPDLCHFNIEPYLRGSGCGSVGRVVASDTRDLRFEPHHRQYLIYQLIYQLCNRKNENKEKEAGNGPSLKKASWLSSNIRGKFSELNFFTGCCFSFAICFAF